MNGKRRITHKVSMTEGGGEGCGPGLAGAADEGGYRGDARTQVMRPILRFGQSCSVICVIPSSWMRGWERALVTAVLALRSGGGGGL